MVPGVQRGAFDGQPGGDLVAGQALVAKLHDPAAGPVLGRCGAPHPERWCGADSDSEQHDGLNQ